MADKRIVEYFRLYRGNYPLDALKGKVLSSGYTQKDIQDALNLLDSELKEKALIVPITASKKFSWLKIAGIAGVLALVLLMASSFFISNSKLSILQLILLLVSSLCMVLFYYGFVVLGKKYQQKLLKVTSLIFIILFILGIIFQIVLMIFPSISSGIFDKIPSNINYGDINSVAGLLFDTLVSVTLVVMGLVLIGIILNILLGISLMKLKDQLKFAKLTGILLIVGSASLVIGIGALILPIAYIFEIVLLFKASQQA